MFNQIFARFIMVLAFATAVKGGTVAPTDGTHSSHTCEQQERSRFSWIDYTIVGIMLVVSCGIGTFYGFFGKKQETSADFLLGGRGMGTMPMAMSLAAGYITAIELLGNPSEMYINGTMFWLQCFAYLLVVPITSYFYLPVFMKLHVTSSYEYLEMRFNKYARVIAAAMYAFQMILYTSVAVYAPALALNEVTGLDVYLAVSLVYLVCVFYASQGGMKAVIMADSFQAAVLVLSILLILIFGNNLVGGFFEVVEANQKSGRIELSVLDLDPKVRHSVWSVIIGGTFYWATMYCSNQTSIQKYMTVESISQARRAIWLSSVSLALVLSINFYTGMIMYTEYKDCDPLISKDISATDQLLPLFVMKSLASYKGIPGLFVAGIFAASLGTVASTLNSLAAVTLKDFFGALCGFNIPDNKGSLYSKWISVFYGLLSFLLIFIIAKLGSLLQVALSFNGMAGGVTLGLFSLGMFVPWANSKGAITGAVTAAGIMLWICFGAQIAIANGFNPAEPKPVSVANCSCFNKTDVDTNSLATMSSEEVWSIYKISYLWYSAIGFFITLFIGVIVSLLTEPQDPCRLHPDLISPPIQYILQRIPNHLKEKLSLPLESKTMAENLKEKKNENLKETKNENPKEKKISAQEIGGIVNPAINLENDVVT